MSSSQPSMVTFQDSTPYTDKMDELTVEYDKVYQNKYATKYFQNKDQLTHVVEWLVLKKDYMLESNYNGKIVLKNKEGSTYTIDVDALSGEYHEKVLVGNLQ
jgi:hypothetical protein